MERLRICKLDEGRKHTEAVGAYSSVAIVSQTMSAGEAPGTRRDRMQHLHAIYRARALMLMESHTM